MNSTSPLPSQNRGFRSLLPYLSLLKGQYPVLLGAIILMLLSTAVALSIPLAAGRLVDAFQQGAATSFIENFPAAGGWLIAGLLVAQLLSSFFFTVLSNHLGLTTVTRLRARIYAHLLELPALYFSKQKAGDISSRVTSDVGSIRYMMTDGLVALIRAVLTLLGAVVLMVRLNPDLSLFVLLLIPATILLVRLFGARLQKLSKAMLQEMGKITSHVQETVSGIRSLKVYNAQTHESTRFGGMIEDYRAAGLKRAWLSAAFESAIQISLWICLLAIVVYGFVLMNRGQSTSGQLVAFLLLAFRVAMPLARLSGLFAAAQGAIAAAERLNEILSLDPERTPGAPAPAASSQAPALRLENVSFRYDPEGEPVLHDLDLTIEKGMKVGIVGPSGGGKTTLAGILLGLFPPGEGRILLDDKPFSEYDVSELRSRMAWVSQDPVLYDLSLAENIRFGMAVGDDAVREAAEQAHVLEFSESLPEGLDTLCGERGGRLSGGQRQRVSLARAFLRNPGLLVLDEPTSALDAASESAITSAMHNLMTGRTAVVIAHRFSLVKNLDLIIVINEGRIVQQGHHAQLMEQDGLYRTLYQLQQGIPGS
jgi:subfamily B ATP-binding cassette protein MsbA